MTSSHTQSRANKSTSAFLNSHPGSSATTTLRAKWLKKRCTVRATHMTINLLITMNLITTSTSFSLRCNSKVGRLQWTQLATIFRTMINSNKMIKYSSLQHCSSKRNRTRLMVDDAIKTVLLTPLYTQGQKPWT